LGSADHQQLIDTAVKGEFDVLCLEAAKRLNDPADLKRVIIEANDWEVVKATLAKLNGRAALGEIANNAADPAVRLAATHRLGQRSWDDIFGSAIGDMAALRNALVALALSHELQPEARSGIQQACLDLIQRGNESSIPEMSDLLEQYGDKALAKYYMNYGVQQACLDLIRRGNKSNIPEMSDLLEQYGDKALKDVPSVSVVPWLRRQRLEWSG
jgi:hypothetical protein